MATVGNPFIIDVEASGFGAESYPIEIGIALAEGSKYCALIIPSAVGLCMTPSPCGVSSRSLNSCARGRPLTASMIIPSRTKFVLE
tara:strand:- start:1149 stop:1406 length:258 start_codon:yes stop_codon:yes gene_type:complete